MKYTSESKACELPHHALHEGHTDTPQCGFPRVAMVLKDIGKPFASFDVLSDPTVRQGIRVRELADNPQLYVMESWWVAVTL